MQTQCRLKYYTVPVAFVSFNAELSIFGDMSVIIKVSNALDINTIPVVICIFPRPTTGDAMPPDIKPAAPRIALARPACLRAAFMAMAVEGASMRPKLPIMAKRQTSNSQTETLKNSAPETHSAEIRSMDVPAMTLVCGVLNLVERKAKMPMASAFVPKNALYWSAEKP